MEKSCLLSIVKRISPNFSFAKIRPFVTLFSLWVVTFTNTSLADSSFIVAIDALEDTYVESEFPNANYNLEEELRTGRGTTEYLSYLKFDLARIPQGRTIISANLKLFCRLSYIQPPVASHYLDDDTWDEETLTWNNCPKNWNVIPSDTQVAVIDHMYFDITDEVIMAFDDDGIISIVLRMPDGYYAWAYFYSSMHEILLNYCPAIEVEISGPKYGGGQGTESNPYLIYTPEQLSWIGDNPSDFSSYFDLMSDVNLSEYTGHEFPIISDSWTDPFDGVFEGNYHVISNFTFTPTKGFNYTGLFGAIGPNSIVRNLGLINPNVDCTGNGTASLAGLVDGLLENCWATSVNIHGGFRAGGLVGHVYEGLVKNCYVNSGNVSLEHNYAGGFVGQNDANIINCYSACTVTGPGTWLGGFVGNNQDGELTACFYDENITGNLTKWTAINSTTEKMQNMVTFTNEGWDFVGETVNGSNDVWDICSGHGYPFLWWQDINCPPKYGGGNGTEQEPYQIHTAQHLNKIGPSIDDWDKHFILMNDIDLSDFVGTEFNLIGDTWTDPFVGVFNGNGHVISNLTYSTTEFYNYMGLFGCVGVNGIVKNLGFIQPALHGGINGTGALTGLLQGTAQNCWAIDVSISGGFRSGGLIGDVYGEHAMLLNSYVDGGDVSVEYNYGGGLVGDNSGKVIYCYSTAAVSGEGWPHGGLIGITSEGGQTIDSFWDTVVSGEHYSDGGTPLETTAMISKDVYLYNNWDFVGEDTNGNEDAWRMCIDGIDYPRLQYQYHPGDLECPDGIDGFDLAYMADEWLMVRLSANVDYRRDNIINMKDWAVFSLAWLSTPTSQNWNQLCDVAPDGGDNVIDVNDLQVFLVNWLKFGNAHLRSDMAPRHNTDKIVNFKDFAKLSEKWLAENN